MDDRQEAAVQNPTWRGREVQWCRAHELRAGDRLITPIGEARISETTFAHHTDYSSVLVACVSASTGDFLDIELKSSWWVMRLERGEPRKESVVRTVSAEGVSVGDWVCVENNRCHKATIVSSAPGGITVMILDPEVRTIDGDLAIDAHHLGDEGQSITKSPALGYLIFEGPASSSVSIVDEGGDGMSSEFESVTATQLRAGDRIEVAGAMVEVESVSIAVGKVVPVWVSHGGLDRRRTLIGSTEIAIEYRSGAVSGALHVAEDFQALREASTSPTPAGEESEAGDE